MSRGLTQAQIVERIERLEQAVNALVDEIAPEVEDPAASVDPEVVKLARDGKRMEAAKLHAEKTGVSFVDAQKAVSAI